MIYEVTGLELDTLVHTAWAQEGVLGARMTGAGFGGCAIALVQKDTVEAFKEAIGKHYEEVVGYAPKVFYIAEVCRWHYGVFRLGEKNMEAVIFDLDGLLADTESFY